MEIFQRQSRIACVFIVKGKQRFSKDIGVEARMTKWDIEMCQDALFHSCKQTQRTFLMDSRA